MEEAAEVVNVEIEEQSLFFIHMHSTAACTPPVTVPTGLVSKLFGSIDEAAQQVPYKFKNPRDGLVCNNLGCI